MSTYIYIYVYIYTYKYVYTLASIASHPPTPQAAADGAKKIRCHVMTDGRDVPDGTGVDFIEALEG